MVHVNCDNFAIGQAPDRRPGVVQGFGAAALAAGGSGVGDHFSGRSVEGFRQQEEVQDVPEGGRRSKEKGLCRSEALRNLSSPGD